MGSRGQAGDFRFASGQKKKKNPPSCRGKADAFTTRLEVERVAVLGRVSHTQWVWLSTMNACDSRDGEDGGKTKDSCH